jgi:hypothetical protein
MSSESVPFTTLNAEHAEFAEKKTGTGMGISASSAVSALIVIW